jgi:formamidase
VAAEAARTAPPRENGGNQDIKNLTKGTRVFYPVFVDGANLSVGDLHFSQGDGEITFCGAYGVSENAIFIPQRRPAVQPVAGVLRHLGHPRWGAALPGLAPVLPAGLPARHRLSDQIRLQRHPGVHDPGFGTDRGSAVRRGGQPNSCSTVYIPTAIFDIDVRPSAAGPAQVTRGMDVPTASF